MEKKKLAGFQPRNLKQNFYTKIAIYDKYHTLYFTIILNLVNLNFIIGFY
jgi:hypothetical protein